MVNINTAINANANTPNHHLSNYNEYNIVEKIGKLCQSLETDLSKVDDQSKQSILNEIKKLDESSSGYFPSNAHTESTIIAWVLLFEYFNPDIELQDLNQIKHFSENFLVTSGYKFNNDNNSANNNQTYFDNIRNCLYDIDNSIGNMSNYDLVRMIKDFAFKDIPLNKLSAASISRQLDIWISENRNNIEGCTIAKRRILESISSRNPKLNLEDLNLTSIPNCINKLIYLNELYLNNNQITAIPENAFSGLNKLNKLDLRVNKIKVLPENIFNGLNELKNLDLSINQIRRIHTAAFSSLNKLELNRNALYGNQMTDLYINHFLRKIKQIRKNGEPYKKTIDKINIYLKGLRNTLLKKSQNYSAHNPVIISQDGIKLELYDCITLNNLLEMSDEQIDDKRYEFVISKRNDKHYDLISLKNIHQLEKNPITRSSISEIPLIVRKELLKFLTDSTWVLMTGLQV